MFLLQMLHSDFWTDFPILLSESFLEFSSNASSRLKEK